MRKRFQKILIYFLTIIIVLANFSLLLAPKNVKAESEFSDWNGSSANFDKSQLEFSDNKLIHTFEISSNQQRQITFQKVGPVNLWDFYKWKYHTDTSASATSGQFYGTPPMPEEGYDINKNIYDKFQTLSSYDYELYKMPDTGQTPLYLIVRRKSTTSGETVGLFSHNLTLHPLRRDLRMVGISPTHQNAYRLETISSKQIEWKPYLYAGFSDTRVEGDFLAIFFNNGALHNVKYDDRDQYGNRGANLYKYIQYFNQRIYAIGEGTAAECPPEAGKSHSVEEYSRCFFQNEGATFNVNSSGPNTFKADQSTSPTITLDEKTWPDGAKRPKISFTLKKVIRARGFERDNRNYMYFFATNPDYPNLAIIFTDCDPNGRLIIKGPSNDISNEEKIGNIGITVNPEIWWIQLINRIYNSGTGAVTTFPNSAEYAVNNCPDIKYINVSDDGWLEKWRVESAEDAGGGEARESTCITGGGGLKYASAAWWISQALCAILEFIGNIGQWITDVFFLSVFNAYSPTTKPMETSYYISPNNDILISRAYAYEAQKGDEVPPLSDALSGKTDKWDWIITVWKFTLGLANLFLVVVLLFLGVVNILHIQYDTYAIKKMLPLLIIGVILANFSLLIMRMLIDASNILTDSFMGNQTPGNMLKDLINAVSINDQNPGFFKAWENVGILLLAVIFAVFAIAGFLILGIMFYIRFAAIVFLGIIAPLAFVAMAFPPTQTVFKQWWSWATKMIFMKPIAFFLLMLALQVKGAPGSTLSITAWIIIVALVYMAILVPWKLGGVVMGMWGGAMGSLFGTKKGGWTRKPVEEWWQRRKDQAREKTRMRIPWLFAGAERDRINTESMKKRADAKVKERAEKDPSVATWRGRAKEAENDLKDLQALQDQAYALGDLKLGLLLRLSAGGIKWENGKPKLATGLDMAKELADSEVDLALDTKDYEATKKDLLQQGVIARIRKARKFMTQIADMQDSGIGMKAYEKNEDGTLKEVEGKLGNYQTSMELVTQLKMEALSLGPEEAKKARNLMASARKLIQEAGQFAQDHNTFQNEAVQYDNFMDKQYYGRGLSLTSPVVAEDSQVLANYESAESMRKRLVEGGGNRNLRFGPSVPVHYFRGEHDQISDYELSAFLPDLGAHPMLLGRGSTQDRAANLASLLGYFKNNVFNQQEFQKFMETMFRAEEMLPGKEGLTRGFMAEQLLAAHNRGAPPPEGLEGIDLTGVHNSDQVAERLKPHDAKIKAYLIEHPEFFASVEMSSPWGARNTMAFMYGYADNLIHSPFLGGPGNLTGNSVGPGFSPEGFYEELLSRDQKTLDNLSNRRDQELAAAERAAEAGRTLSTTPPSQLAPDPSAAARLISRPENQQAYNNFMASQATIANRFKVSGGEVSPEGFRQIAASILSSSAQTAQDLRSELQTQFTGLSFKITPELRTPEGFAAFKDELAASISGVDCFKTLEGSAYAQDALRSVPVRPDETRDQLAASSQSCEDAINALRSAFEQIKISGGEIPKEVQNKFLDAISQRQQVTPLTKELLLERPEKASDVLQKMMVVLRAALKTKDTIGEGNLEEKIILKQIEKDLHEKLNIPAAPQPPPGGPPPTPPAQPPTTPAGPGTPPAAQPPDEPPLDAILK